jgi:hypothetical protein
MKKTFYIFFLLLISIEGSIEMFRSYRFFYIYGFVDRMCDKNSRACVKYGIAKSFPRFERSESKFRDIIGYYIFYTIRTILD